MAAALAEADLEEDTTEASEVDTTEASADLITITDPLDIGAPDPSLEAGITVPITTEAAAVSEDF